MIKIHRKMRILLEKNRPKPRENHTLSLILQLCMKLRFLRKKSYIFLFQIVWKGRLRVNCFTRMREWETASTFWSVQISMVPPSPTTGICSFFIFIHYIFSLLHNSKLIISVHFHWILTVVNYGTDCNSCLIYLRVTWEIISYSKLVRSIALWILIRYIYF